ncbi:tail fiber protein [Enterobacter ludwigii]|uniref:tail fiber protein n=1 Tax=Enterobacter ludwigii TaxID=299767 RepID=UPI003975FB18
MSDNLSTPRVAEPFPFYGDLGTTNLNNLTGANFGIYFQPYSGNIYSGLNYPEDSPGSLTVLKIGERACSQEFYSLNSNMVYRRRYYLNSILWTWSPWIQEYNTENPPLADNLRTLDRVDFPVGILAIWSSEFPPDGWLICDGSSFCITDNPSLSKIYPSGYLPDIRPEHEGLRYIIRHHV